MAEGELIDYEVIWRRPNVERPLFIPLDGKQRWGLKRDEFVGHIVKWPEFCPGPIVAGLYFFKPSEPRPGSVDDSVWICAGAQQYVVWWDDALQEHVKLPYEEWRH